MELDFTVVDEKNESSVCWGSSDVSGVGKIRLEGGADMGDMTGKDGPKLIFDLSCCCTLLSLRLSHHEY